MSINGGNLETASILDYIMHAFTFWLKFVFCVIPPPGMMQVDLFHFFIFSIISFFNDSIQGWPAFVVSLIFIGFLAAVISDFAKIFGCLVGLRDEVTAITIVTFGTSMIDVFATRKAVKMDSTADNSLGNVIAANSISVFLGKS